MIAIWSDEAKADLRGIYDYISKDSEFWAKKTIRDILEKEKYIAEYPNGGRVVPEYGDEKVREVFHKSYRILYELQNERIEILAVLHGSRDLTEESLE